MEAVEQLDDAGIAGHFGKPIGIGTPPRSSATVAGMTPILDAETIRAFREDGACVLRGHFADWIDTLRDGVAADMAAPGPGVRIYGGEDGSGRFFGDYCNWDRIDEFRRFVFDSTVAPIAAELMGSQQVRLFHKHVLVKEPGSDTTTPWHQDGRTTASAGL